MNYEGMTDAEINVSVHNLILPRGDKFDNFFNDLTPQDYCNSPSDAWPVISENEIDLEWNEGECTAARYWSSSTGHDDIHYHDKNPLRAAAIVYLKMMEAQR